MHLIEHAMGHDEAQEDGADLYTTDGIDASSDDDEISIAEEGFMHGYLES